MNYFTLITFFIISFFIEGCNSSNFILDDNATTINGVVVDGYIQNAKVCLDINNDSICQDTEDSAITNEFGIFHLSTFQEKNATLFLPIIAYEGLDTSTQKNFQDQIKNIIDYSALDENTSIIISPLTDLVTVSFLARENNSSEGLKIAKSSAATALNISTDDLNKDPMKDIKLFAISQELQHSKFLIQILFEKNIDYKLSLAEKTKLQNDIKNAILSQGFNIANILTIMEINENISIPENEKTFTIKQLEELKTTLDKLSQDTSLDIDNLNRLQKSIDIKQSLAIKNLQNAKDAEAIDIVSIDITTESITQTDFDTKDAILDENACTATNNYHVLKNSGFMPDKTEDSENGISLKSNYSFNKNNELSEVQLFYPDLNQTKENDDVIVLEGNIIFTFDKAWTKNENKTIYIQTPKEDENGKYSCYKYVLNFRVPTDVKPTKVFRYNEIN